MASAAGKTVIVTGAAGGLGKAIAAAFLAAGANVVICDVSPARLAETEVEWKKDAERFLAVQTDVTSAEAVAELFSKTVARFGRLDVLVNNAGIMDDFSPVGACTPEMWNKVLGVNLTGPYHTCKAAVQQMEAQEPKGGLIINIASNASVRGYSAGIAYTASKAGLVAMTKNTAGFYGPKGISSCALLLGAMGGTNIHDAFQTGMHMEMYQHVMSTMTPLGADHSVPIESVAKYCVFLSDKDIAMNANGSCISFNKNWPEA